MAADLFLFLGLGFLGVVLTGIFSGPEALVQDDERPSSEPRTATPTVLRPTLVPPPSTVEPVPVGSEDRAPWPPLSIAQERRRAMVLFELSGLLFAAALLVAAIVAGGGWLVVRSFRAIAGF